MPGCNGVTFKPYLSGERTPHLNPDLRGSFTGLSLANTQADLVRSVLEGVAFSLRDALDIIEPLAPLERALATGAGQSRMYGCSWSRMSSSFLYSVLNKTREQPTGRHFSRCKGSEWSKMRLELLNDRQAKPLRRTARRIMGRRSRRTAPSPLTCRLVYATSRRRYRGGHRRRELRLSPERARGARSRFWSVPAPRRVARRASPPPVFATSSATLKTSRCRCTAPAFLRGARCLRDSIRATAKSVTCFYYRKTQSNRGTSSAKCSSNLAQGSKD